VRLACAAWLCSLVFAAGAHAEDGYDLWLRYRPIEAPMAARYRSFATEVVTAPGAGIAARELMRGMAGLLAVTPGMASRITRDGAIVLSTPGSAGLGVPRENLDRLESEGYLIRSIEIQGHRATLIAANSNIGLLYGTFGLLRLMQTRRSLQAINLRESPRIARRNQTAPEASHSSPRGAMHMHHCTASRLRRLRAKAAAA
jgi:alpha-glucuronidase